MKKFISFFILFLFSLTIISETFARSSSSSSSRSSSSFSRSSSSSSRSSSSSSSRSSSYSSFSKPATKRATNTSWTPTYSRITSSSDFGSRFSTTDMLLLYLLVSWNSSTSANNLSETEKQKIIDEYNKDPSKYEDKLATCSSVSEKEDVSTVTVNQWNIKFSGFTGDRVKLLWAKESYFKNINDRSISGFQFIDIKENKESKLEWNCLVSVTKKVNYVFSNIWTSTKTFSYFPINGEQLLVTIDWVSITNPKSINIQLDNKETITLNVSTLDINSTPEEGEPENYKFVGSDILEQYEVSYKDGDKVVTYKINDWVSFFYVSNAGTKESNKIKDSTFNEEKWERVTWIQITNVYSWSGTKKEEIVNSIVNKNVKDLKVKLNWKELEKVDWKVYLVTNWEAQLIQEKNTDVIDILIYWFLIIFVIWVLVVALWNSWRNY